jgi:NADPH:quinone reductase-like Zn-dependent oxidoreductase
MKAIVQNSYGPPAQALAAADVPTPTPGAGEVLVRVRASSANPYDWHLVCGEPVLMRGAGIGGVRAPKGRVMGADLAGVVERLGAGVTGLAVGDAVYGFAAGAWAEAVSAPAGRLARMPATLTFEQAATVPLAAITALQCLRRGGLAAGQRVLIIGASGGVGTFAVQIARHAGADVTGVCSTGRVDLVRGLGANHVIDYTATDLTATPGRYDLIVQLGGTYPPRRLARLLTPTGTLVLSYGDGNRWLGPLVNMAQGALLNVVSKRRIVALVADETTAALDELRDLIDAGHVHPVLDATFPLDRAAEALTLVKDGRPAGKVAITVTDDAGERPS